MRKLVERKLVTLHTEVGRPPVPLLGAGRSGEPLLVSSVWDGSQVRRWDLDTGQPVWSYDEIVPGSNDQTLVRCPGDDVWLVVATEDGIEWWDARTGRHHPEMTWECWTIWALATGRLPDGRTGLFGAGQNGVVHQWDVTSGELVWNFPETDLPGSMMSVELVSSPGAATVVVSGDDAGRIWRWDAMTGEQMGDPVVGHASPVRILEAPAGGEEPMFFSTDQEGVIRGWNAFTGAPVGPAMDTGAQVFSLATAIVGDTEILFAAGADTTVRAWQVSTGDPIYLSLTGAAVSALSRPDGTALLATSSAADGVTVHECSAPAPARPSVPG